jgi:hypothetical protein
MREQDGQRMQRVTRRGHLLCEELTVVSLNNSSEIGIMVMPCHKDKIRL